MCTAIRFSALVLCMGMVLTAVLFSAPVVKADSNPTITVDSVTGMTRDELTVNLAVSGNTGIMAITITIHYDNTALEYLGYSKGILMDYLVVDHGTYLTFVNCEITNCSKDGNLISLKFKVKETAVPGFYPITIGNAYPDKYGDSLKGCFANWQRTEISPTVIAGGVSAFVRGDVNGDGKGDIKDLICVKRHIANTGYTVSIPQGGDFDHDGLLFATDLVGMRHFLFGL